MSVEMNIKFTYDEYNAVLGASMVTKSGMCEFIAKSAVRRAIEVNSIANDDTKIVPINKSGKDVNK